MLMKNTYILFWYAISFDIFAKFYFCFREGDSLPSFHIFTQFFPAGGKQRVTDWNESPAETMPWPGSKPRPCGGTGMWLESLLSNGLHPTPPQTCCGFITFWSATLFHSLPAGGAPSALFLEQQWWALHQQRRCTVCTNTLTGVTHFHQSITGALLVTMSHFLWGHYCEGRCTAGQRPYFPWALV